VEFQLSSLPDTQPQLTTDVGGQLEWVRLVLPYALHCVQHGCGRF